MSTTRTDLRAAVPGGELRGWVAGEGEPVLVLHGGPGLSYDYLDPLAADIGEGYRVAAFQQRGLAPSLTDGPFDVARAVEDVVAVLDSLGWERAWVLGHSWGGHLLWHLAVSAPERLLGGLALDPLGGVGDGGEAAFEAELTRRTPPEDMDESLRLLWPAYFASPDDTLPYVSLASSLDACSGLWDSLKAELPRLEAALPSVRVRLGVVIGGASPMPIEAAAATARAIPGAWLDVVEGAGHFPYYERPGCVRAGLDRLTGAR